MLFAEEGLPDGMFFYEDMGFKNRPFMSPAMYEEIMQPGHKRLFDYRTLQGLQGASCIRAASWSRWCRG